MNYCKICDRADAVKCKYICPDCENRFMAYESEANKFKLAFLEEKEKVRVLEEKHAIEMNAHFVLQEENRRLQSIINDIAIMTRDFLSDMDAVTEESNR